MQTTGQRSGSLTEKYIYLTFVKRLFVSMKKHARRTAEAHHCASFAPSSEAPPAHQHNNSNNKKHVGRFPADDELGFCRTSRVSPEQPVLCVPVEYAHLTDQHANKLQHLDATVCTKRANPKHYTKQLLVCAGYVDFDAENTRVPCYGPGHVRGM